MTDISGPKKLVGDGKVVAKPASNFRLQNQDGVTVALSDLLKDSSLLLVFYPGDFTPVCTAQLCNYRDNLSVFEEFGIKVVGISPNPVASHKDFAKQYDFPFPLLSDPGGVVAKDYGCQSIWMFGKSSRAVFVVNKKALVLYRYVEPTIVTRRKASELVDVLTDLKKHGLL